MGRGRRDPDARPLEHVTGGMSGGLRPLRFGVNAAGSSRDSWTARARRVEDLGYDVFYIGDHLGSDSATNDFGALALAPISAITAAAVATTRLRVGAGVFNNDLRHPCVLGKEMTSVDVISGGRLEFGLGAGWREPEYQQCGIPFDPACTRIDRMVEALDIIERLWSGEVFSYKGRHYAITEFCEGLRPLQTPHPPIIIGARERRMLTLAGQRADIVNVAVRRHPGAGFDAADASFDGFARKRDAIVKGAGDRFEQLELSTTFMAVHVGGSGRETAARINADFAANWEAVVAGPHIAAGSADEITERILRWRSELQLSCFIVTESEIEAFAPIVAALAGK
jgi:probable F420-dependent oxidoreductase